MLLLIIKNLIRNVEVAILVVRRLFPFLSSLSLTQLYRTVAVIIFSLVFPVIFATHTLAVSSTTPIVTLGDGIDASSTVLGPGFSATNTDSFTLRTSTTTSQITSVTVNLNAGGANNGITWATSSTVGMNNSWLSVAYGDGMFVAISASTTNNSVMTSPDGVTWTLRTATSTNGWQSVTYGNGLFVAVADSGAGYRVMTSATGTVWTSASSTTPNNIWKSVTYGNGLFVAVAATTTTTNVMTSTDGKVWTSRTGATSNQWSSVTYGNGLFVAVATSGTGNRVMTSADGITWTSRTSATNNLWTSVSYGAGLYVAVSASSTASNIMTSPDGITWTQRSSSNFNASSTISYGNGLFVIVSATTSTANVVTSPDGINWTTRTSPVTNQWKGVVYGNGVFVTVGQTGAGNRAMLSTSGTDPQTVLGRNNGGTWATTTVPYNGASYSVAYGNGIFVALVFTGIAVDNKYMTSPDGLNWTARTFPTSDYWYKIIYGDGKFVVAMLLGSTVLTSTDALSWATTSTSMATTVSLAYGKGTYVALTSGLAAASSNDAITWTARSTPSPLLQWSSVTYGNGLFVAVSSTATTSGAMTSPDGINWTLRTTPNTNLWQSVTFGNGLFVAVSNSGLGNRVMTSPDGITWTARTSPANFNWSYLAYGNGIYIASSATSTGDNSLMKSTDGINWSLASSTPGYYHVSLSYGNGSFLTFSSSSATTLSGVAVSNSGTYYNNSEYYRGVSRVEITNNAGDTVYTSVDNPTSDKFTLSLASSPIVATTTNVQYRIRITPKQHSDFPIAESGTLYPIKAKIVSLISASGTVEGEDAAGATTTVDNTISGITPTNNLSWTATSINGLGSYFVDITYGNGLFVAVQQFAGNNNILTSADGFNWTPNSAASSSMINGITYGNGLFVIVTGTAPSGSPSILTSTDGLNWAIRTSSEISSREWYQVTYGGGIFVAISYNGSANDVITSPDGFTWTLRSTPILNAWNSITYGNGIFVVVANSASSSNVMTSPDGVNWTLQRSALPGNGLTSVAYGDGSFVALTDGFVMSSADGIRWASTTLPVSSSTGHKIIYINGYFIATVYAESSASSSIMTSTTGTSWSVTPNSYIPFEGSGSGKLTYGKGTIIAISSNGGTYGVASTYTSSAYSNRVSLTFTTPSDSDLSSILVLKSTDATGDTPLEGTTYATSSRIGASDVVCAFSVATSTSYTCNSTFNTYNGTPYYFKLFTRDIYGNYSAQVLTSSTTPGRSITLGTGTEASSTIILAPGGTATTTDVFTLQTDTGTDIITSVDVSFTSGTATSTSLIEILNNAGTTVYGSVSTTTSDTVTIPLTTTTLTATSGPTQYRVRITPKSHVNMPDVSAGSTYIINSYISNLVGTNITNENGSDTSSTTVVIDNGSPENVDELGVKWRYRVPSAYLQWQEVVYASSTFMAISSSGTGNRVMTSPDGITWTGRTTIVDNQWRSIAYGSSTFIGVAVDDVGAGNRVMSSINGGVSWVAQTAAASNEWESVVYAKGLFVAVSNSNLGTIADRVMTSPNGVTWTSRTAASNDYWYSITYGNGLFVAVGASGAVMTSPDGITWTSRTSPNNNSEWRSVAYGNSMFVAVANSGIISDRVMTSPDGITWTGRGNSSTAFTTVTYGNGLFVAGTQYDGILTSPDGITWTTRNTSTEYWSGTAYGTSTFVAVAIDGQSIISSRGPILSATGSQITITSYTPSITDLANILVLQSTSTPVTDTPTEGVSYATSSLVGTATAICSVSVAASTTHTCTASGLTNGTPYYFKIFTQDTTGNWSTGVALTPTSPGTTTVTLGSGNDTTGFTIAPGASATTSDTFTFQTSNGSSTITSVTVTVATTTATSTSLIEITNDRGTVVYGSSTNPTSDVITIPLTFNTLTATSGITQYRIRVTPKTHANMPPPASGTAYNFTSYISSWIGSGARMAGDDYATTTATTTTIVIDNASPEDIVNPVTGWKLRTPILTDNLTDGWSAPTYGNGLFVAVSATTTSGLNVITSPDGVNWTTRTGTTTNRGWSSVAYGNGLFVAVSPDTSDNNGVMTSPDGITWTLRTGTTTTGWNSIVYGNGLFLVGGRSSMGSMTSPDGITWTYHDTPTTVSKLFYYNNKFYAWPDFSTIFYTSDGITWTDSGLAGFVPALASGDDYYGYSNSKLVLLGLSGSVAAVSDRAGTVFTSYDYLSNSLNMFYYQGYFYSISGSGALLYSLDGITWSNYNTSSVVTYMPSHGYTIAYNDRRTVYVSNYDPGAGYTGAIVSAISATSSVASTQVSLTFTTPNVTDVATATVLRSTSAITDTPTEGTTYATSSTIGASTVACSFSVIASSTYTCTSTGLTNGTPYYFKIFLRDTNGNWSVGANHPDNPIAPGTVTVTLGAGTSSPSVSLKPGDTATTSDTFTVKTSSGTDIITTATVIFSSSTAEALSLVEITNDTGATVYGSTANPTSDTVAITLGTNTLTANTTQTQYRVRITPKTGASMPAVPGSTYTLRSYISSINGTSASITGSDVDTATTTIITIDNESPSVPTTASGYITANKQVILTYTNPSTTDATSTIVLRATSPITDVPVEGSTYTAGNTIGSATVACVSNDIVLSASASCIDTTGTKGRYYYYKIFSKDNAGNYSSTGVTPTGQPFIINTEAGGYYIELETQNGGTVVNTGGGDGAGAGNSNASSTNATTTNTGGGNGGGGGDSGFIYHGSNIAAVFKKAFGNFFTSVVTGGASSATAKVQIINQRQTEAVPPADISTCSVRVFGVCVVSSSP